MNHPRAEPPTLKMSSEEFQRVRLYAEDITSKMMWPTCVAASQTMCLSILKTERQSKVVVNGSTKQLCQFKLSEILYPQTLCNTKQSPMESRPPRRGWRSFAALPEIKNSESAPEPKLREHTIIGCVQATANVRTDEEVYKMQQRHGLDRHNHPVYESGGERRRSYYRTRQRIFDCNCPECFSSQRVGASESTSPFTSIQDCLRHILRLRTVVAVCLVEKLSPRSDCAPRKALS